MSEPDRTAIVTGASRGIGAAIARRLAADGFRIVVNYASNETEANRIVREICWGGGRAVAFAADVADAAAFRSLFDQAESEFGEVDVLVNNAGVSKMSRLADVSDEDYQLQLAVNLTGAFNGMREGARRIRDGGRIVNLSTSIVGTYMPASAVYAATKSAVEAMTRVLAKELGPRGVTVNAIAPGPIATDLLFAGRSEEMIQRLVSDIPMGRLGTPEDIARVVSFLSGEDGGWVSGQIIRTNGGRN